MEYHREHHGRISIIDKKAAKLAGAIPIYHTKGAQHAISNTLGSIHSGAAKQPAARKHELSKPFYHPGHHNVDRKTTKRKREHS